MIPFIVSGESAGVSGAVGTPRTLLISRAMEALEAVRRR